jgi:hypothetical protein
VAASVAPGLGTETGMVLTSELCSDPIGTLQVLCQGLRVPRVRRPEAHKNKAFSRIVRKKGDLDEEIGLLGTPGH